MVDELVFYTHPMSRGRIVRWMLEEIGRPYRTELLEFGTTMKAPAYLAVNPMGKVPAIRHGDTVVTEAAAICAYLAGDSFTAADVYLGAQIGWGMMFGTIEKRPAFERYWQRISARPAAVRARQIDDALLPPRPPS
jgi:glutathione S-transferase